MKNLMKKVIVMMMAAILILGMNFYGMPATIVQGQARTIQVTIKHPEMNTISLSWNKVSGAYGYKIYYKSSKKSSYELVSDTLEQKIVVTGLESDQYYQFRIEAYGKKGKRECLIASSKELKVRSNRIGIDVSKWNGKIDWNKVKQDGIEFAIIRVAYGTSKTAERMYRTNIEGAKKAGIPVGVYIYSIATNEAEAKKEAAYVASLIKGYRLEYPVAFDIEDKNQMNNGMSSEGRKKNTRLTKAFCDSIEAAGYRAMVYTGCSFSRTYMNFAELSKYDAWIAHYGDSKHYTKYSGAYHYGRSCKANKTRFWQYSEHGKVDGIKGKVDMNYELHLGETTYGKHQYNVAKKEESYVAASGESLTTIAKKYGVSVAQLIAGDKNYTKTSVIKKGSKIKLNTSILKTKRKVQEQNKENNKQPVVHAINKVQNPKAQSTSADSIRISWSKVKDANGYFVYRSMKKNGTYTKIGTTTGTSFEDKKLINNKAYYYKVYGYKKSKSQVITSPSAVIVSAIPVQPAVTNLKVSKVSSNAITIVWKKSNQAVQYNVFVSNTKNGKYRKVGKTKSTRYTQKRLVPGRRYYYRVEAVGRKQGKSYYSKYTAPVSATTVLGKPVISGKKVVKGKNIIRWNKVKDAKGYIIYRAEKRNGTYKPVATGSGTSYTDKHLTAKRKYYYRVRAYQDQSKKRYYGAYSTIVELTAK